MANKWLLNESSKIYQKGSLKEIIKKLTKANRYANFSENSIYHVHESQLKKKNSLHIVNQFELSIQLYFHPTFTLAWVESFLFSFDWKKILFSFLINFDNCLFVLSKLQKKKCYTVSTSIASELSSAFLITRKIFRFSYICRKFFRFCTRFERGSRHPLSGFFNSTFEKLTNVSLFSALSSCQKAF